MDTIKITPPAGSPIEITPLSESYARTALQEIDTLVLHYELPEHTDLPLGSTASFRGTTYTLYKTSDLTMHHSRAYEYTATLYGDGERTRLYKVVNLVDGRLSFTLTAKPHEHLQMLVDTLNKREGAGTWTAGSIPDGTEITIAYDHISVLDALVQLATKLETEWGITGTTLHIGKLTSSSEPLSLRYGRGKGILPDIRRTPVDDYPIGRLYANGGSRNIDPSTYGSKTLHFPKGATETYDGQVYHTDPTGTYVYTEGAAATSSDTSIDLTHIYPSRIGSVTKVEVTKEGAVDILDSTIPETLDYEKQLLEGQTLTVKFETGMLAGREAFGAKYIHRDRRLQIVPRDEDGVTIPGGVYLPKEGDKYTVFGCSLPLQYISDAETAMLSEAVKYLHSHQTEQYNITIELDGIYTKQHWGEIGSRLALGHRVRFTDPSWQPTPVDIRILGITTYLSRPYSPKLDLSNSPLPSSFTAVIKRVEGDQLVREEEYRGGLRRLEKRTYEDAKATREMIERLRVEGFTHSITPETLRTLQAVIGSPALQFAFSTSDGKRVLPLAYSWEKGHTELHLPGGQYILRGGNGSTLSPASEGKVVPMAEYTYSLKDEETQHYLYADLTSKSYKVSATPMEITDTRLLVALIHGMGDSRTLTPLYGFTEITPGQLKTDLIRSQDGKSYWDLLSGTFATTGDLLIGDPKGNTCLAYIDGVLYVKGLTVNVGSASTTIEDALIEQEQKLKEEAKARAKAEAEQKREIENAKKVRQPIIKNGTWWVWDDTTNQLIDSGKPAQGESGHSLTSSLAFVEGEIRNGVVTKDPVVEYIVYYDGVALDDKLVYDTAGAYEQSFEDNRILIVGKNRFRLYFEDNYRSQPNGISQTYVITYKGLTTTATATMPNVRDGERGLQGLQGKDGRDGINGKDGLTAYTHIAYADTAAGEGFSQSPAGKSYVGMYVDHTAADSTSPSAYAWSLIKGADGRDGTPGKPGKDGRTPYLHIAYANSPDGKQGFSVTESSGRDYIGQYTDYLQPDSSDPARYTWSRIKGEKGDKGEQGHSLTLSLSSPSECRNGKVKDGEIHFDWDLYYDGQVVPRNDDLRGRVVIWSDQKTRREEVSESQILDEGIYFVGRLDLSRGLTLYLKASYKGLVATASTFVPNVVDGKDGAPGLQGLQGKQGKQGLPGKDGKDGLTAYTHIAYADTAAGEGFSQSPAGKSYVGMYVDHTAADSTSPSAYAWSLIKGADGRDGTPGKPGKDGRTPYLHIAYANSPDGKQGFSVTESSGRDYIGQYTDYLQPDSSDPARYTWSRIKGESGHSLTSSLKVTSGYIRNGYISAGFKLVPTFLYDGEDVTAEAVKNMSFRWDEGQGQGFVSWIKAGLNEGGYVNYEDIDLSNDYEGEGATFEVKTTYRGLATVASAFVPHIKDGTEGLKATLILTGGNEIRNETGGFSKCKYCVFLNGKKLTKKEVAESTTVTITYTSTHNGEEITSDATSVFKSSATASGSGDHYDLDTDGADDISSGLVVLTTKYKGYEVSSSATIYNVNDGEDGHSFTASLIVEGKVADGRIGLYYMHPSFFYDGREVTEEIGANFYSRYNLNENGSGWSPWKQHFPGYEDFDLSDTYSGPGLSFEVKATYKGLTAIASAFVPHSISPEKLKSITDGLQSATTVIKSLQEAQDAIDRKMISEEQLSSMKYLLDAIKYGDFGNLGGLLLAQVLALSNRDKKITSYMSGFDGKGQHMLAAGVTGFGTSNERADVYLDHDGDFYLSKDDTFLKFDPQGRFALTLFGGKLNIPGVLYAGYFTETNLRSLGGPCKADYSFGQLAVLAKSRYGGAVLLEDVSPNSFYFDQGYEQAWRVGHYAGTKNYVPVVVGGLQTAIQTLEEDYFEFVIQTQPQPRPLGSIYILILGENRANYD